jgi:hypothetical protein
MPTLAAGTAMIAGNGMVTVMVGGPESRTRDRTVTDHHYWRREERE